MRNEEGGMIATRKLVEGGLVGETFRNDLVKATGKPCTSSRRTEQVTGSESYMGLGDKICGA